MGEDNIFSFDKVKTTKDGYSLDICSLPLSYSDYYTSGIPAMISTPRGMNTWWTQFMSMLDTKKLKEIMFEPIPKQRRIKCPMKKKQE
jgi:hypothetical protein